MKKALNLGCQIHHFDSTPDVEWINQDIVGDDPNIRVEMVCDAAKLPLEDESVDFIYAGHLVEHYYPDTLPEAVREWHRVLKPGGKLIIVTPDCGVVFRDYAAGKISIEATWQQIYGRIYSWDGAPERHHIAFDFENLFDMTQKDIPLWGFRTTLDFNNPPIEIAPQMDVHISRAGYQLGIILEK